MSKDIASILPKSGQLSKTGWNLPANLTEQEWKQAGSAIAKVEGAMMWWLGDWWAFGNHAYGDRKALVDSDDWDGPAFQTCKNAAWVCDSIEKSRRRDVISFSHHAECASLPPEEADKILDACEAHLKETGKLPTIKQTREKVKSVKAWLAQGWNTSQLERKALVEQGITVVASMREDDTGKQADAALLAWADQQGLHKRIDRNTDWGNPFELPGDGGRDEVCDKFAKHYMPNKPSLHKKLHTLKGRVLVCWCHPERCHGDHLAELANDS